MRRLLLLAILVGIGFLASSDTVSLGAPDVSTREVPRQPEGDDKDNDGDKNGDRAAAIDDRFAKVAKKHPEFGGMFIDEEEDTISVFLRDGDLDAVVKTLKKVFGEGNLPQRNARARKATYSFQQLKGWHDRMEKLFQIPDVQLTDINDETNRLTVGIENLDARGQVEEQLEALGIPIEAVDIEEIGPFQLSQLPSSPECEEDVTSINARCRPLVGGLQMTFFRFGVGDVVQFACTLGFIAERDPAENGGEGFVTNSHCSFTMGEPDGTVYYQPSFDGNSQIGIETVDLDFCLGVPCRMSDSNFSVLVEGVAGVGRGYVARPNMLNTLEAPCFGEENEPLNPEFCAWDGKRTFRITAEAYSFVGTGVTKVGRRTGRTEGLVLKTGSTVRHTASTLLRNQVVADYAAEEGDSGAPVIRAITPDPNGNPVDTALLGLHWGFPPTARPAAIRVFSPIQGVEADLGPLNTCAPPFQC